MQKQTIQFVRSLVLFPFLGTASPFAMLQTFNVPVIPIIGQQSDAPTVITLNEEHAAKIDAYMNKRGMPLTGYGAKMVAESEKNGIDWRLLPSIAIKESTGGKFACGHNPFGWGSCKIEFETWSDAIETVARNLGGNNPNTARYYKDKTTVEKLHHYNNSVVPTYTGEILEFMKLIEEGK
ncbi:MAG: hypothetical protein UY07_C0017G0013 [Parcubacteria group bacterium GW2011_GWA1_47_8]|nr:hypothetical protein [uncultured bacterium]KKU81475.1 MAG: hypothetical protein UY07_C0017G0013 [Parcubacteria group bacterium GW2011_GWA1_47_8]